MKHVATVLIEAENGTLSKATREALEASMEGELSPRHRLILEAAHRHLRYLEDELAALDRYLIEAMHPYAWAWQLLQTIPGIDQISAAIILIEISDDLTRFGTADRLASWAGLCPGNHESAGKRKSGKTRHGNPIVRCLLCEVANAARRTKSVFRAKYDSLVLRRGHKKAIIALAHKLLRTIFFVPTRVASTRSIRTQAFQLLVSAFLARESLSVTIPR